MAIIRIHPTRGFRWYYLVALVALLGIIGIIVWLYTQERLSLKLPGRREDVAEAA